MKLKRYKPLLLQVGILLLIASIGLFIIENQKRFITIDFSKHYFPNKTIELSEFEEGEGWRGNFSFDSQRVMEGKTSMTFSSWYGASNSINKKKVVKLSKGYVKGYVSLFILDKKNLSAIDSLKLTLSENEKNNKEYNLTPSLHLGWNRVPLIIPNWKMINDQSLTITSKKGTIAEINLDRFWIENTTAYTSDILTTKSQSVSLRTIGERTYLFYASPLKESFTFTAPKEITNGIVSLSLIPEHGNSLMLSINSTSMQIGGANMSSCTLFQDKINAIEKTLKNSSAKDSLYVFLRAEVRNGRVVYSLSNNGIDFENCGEVKSEEKKPIQLTLQGSFLIDSYEVEY